MSRKHTAKSAANASRRKFLKAAGAGTATAAFGAVTLSAKQAQAAAFDAEYD
ncbi:MAG: twin-arginine translocation signal domain-containing protein, partial [Burkholderiales bacterium]